MIMQGAMDDYGKRFPSKKALREWSAAGHDWIVEATSWHGNEFDGSILRAPDGTYSIVGPDPYRDRRWYATVTKRDGKVTVK